MSGSEGMCNMSCVPAAVVGAGALLWQASRGGMDSADGATQPSLGGALSGQREPSDAVLVFGSTGKLGRLVVQKASRCGQDHNELR